LAVVSFTSKEKAGWLANDQAWSGMKCTFSYKPDSLQAEKKKETESIRIHLIIIAQS